MSQKRAQKAAKRAKKLKEKSRQQQTRERLQAEERNIERSKNPKTEKPVKFPRSYARLLNHDVVSQVSHNMAGGALSQLDPYVLGEKSITVSKPVQISALALMLYYMEQDWVEDEIMEAAEGQSEDDLIKVPEDQNKLDRSLAKQFQFSLGGSPVMMRTAKLLIPLLDSLSGAFVGYADSAGTKEYAREIVHMPVLFIATIEADEMLFQLIENNIKEWQIPFDLRVLARRIVHEFVERSKDGELSYAQCIGLAGELEPVFMAEIKEGRHLLSAEEKAEFMHKIELAYNSRISHDAEADYADFNNASINSEE